MALGGVWVTTAASTHEGIGQLWKPSVRLDDKRALLLRGLSAEIGCPPSEVLRRSLDCYAASRLARPRVSGAQQVARAGASQPSKASRESPKAVPSAVPELCRTVPVKDAPCVPSTSIRSTPSVQARHAELVAQYRHFGCKIWRERNRLFQRLLAAAEVAKANNENPRDAELYTELSRVGQQFGMFN
jgi:hypothetical protein